MNPSTKRASNPGPVPNALFGYMTQDSGSISDTVTIEDLEISLTKMAKGLSEETQQRVQDLLSNLTGKDADACGKTLSDWKGWFTREIKYLDYEIKLASETAESKEMLNRLYNAHLAVEIRCHALTSGLDHLSKLDQGNVSKYLDDATLIYEQFLSEDRKAFRCMNDIKSELEKNAFKSRQAENLETIDASLGSMSIGPRGNMHPAEIQVKTNNLVEVSTGRDERKCTPEKLLKYLIFMGCLLFLIITVIILGLKHSGETDVVKQCLPGYYNFPECIRK